MDFFKDLLTRSNKSYVKELSEIRYQIDEDDYKLDPSQTFNEDLQILQQIFIDRYDKQNNRQFKLTKRYRLDEYNAHTDRYERSHDMWDPFKNVKEIQ